MYRGGPDLSGLPSIELFEMPFDIMEFNAVLSAVKEKSCPGLDGIDYFIIKKLTPRLQKCLLALFNEIYISGLFIYLYSQKNGVIF